MNINMRSTNFPASALQSDFVALMLRLGVMKLPRVREPRRWELREQGKLPPHSHLREKMRHREQQVRIAAKKSAARSINRIGRHASPSAIRRELREFPYLHM